MSARRKNLVKATNIQLTRGQTSILDHVDLTVRSGEIVTLIGPNGAGKTSLVRILLKLETPDKGKVHHHPGLTVSYVPQKFSVNASFPLTAARFILSSHKHSRFDLFGKSSGTQKKLKKLAEETGIAHRLDNQMSNLSGGEFQRVCLARALMRDPQLLVLDEPVQGIDFAGETEIYRLIASIRQNRGCGILLISHDLHIVMAESDRVVCLDHHICCSGTPDKVVNNPEYERLFGTDAVQAYGYYKHKHDHKHGPSGEIIELEKSTTKCDTNF